MQKQININELGNSIPDERMRQAYFDLCQGVGEHLRDLGEGSFGDGKVNMKEQVTALVCRSALMLEETYMKNDDMGSTPADLGGILCIIASNWNKYFKEEQK